MKRERTKLRIATFLTCLLLLTAISFAGCSTDFAKKEYDSDTAIASSNHNIKIGATWINKDNSSIYTAKKFDGRDTCMKKSFSADKEVSVKISLNLTNGKAKVVYINNNKDVTTLIECAPDTSLDNSVTQSVNIKKGNILTRKPAT